MRTRVLAGSIVAVLAGTAWADDRGAGVNEVTKYGGKSYTQPEDPATDAGCKSAVKALRARLDVSNVRCEPSLYKTSAPPKLLVTYTYGGETYREYVTAQPLQAADSTKKAKPRPKAAPKLNEAPKPETNE